MDFFTLNAAKRYADETMEGAGAIQGEKGETGEKGADGVSCTHEWNGTTLTVTSASGTSEADLKGEKGDTGEQGEAGKDGTTYVPSIGTVNTVDSDTTAAVTLDVNEETATATYNFDIPKGKDGVQIDDDNVSEVTTYSSNKIETLYPYPLEVTEIPKNSTDIQLTYLGKDLASSGGAPDYKLYVIRVYNSHMDSTYGLCYWDGMTALYDETFTPVEVANTANGADRVKYTKDGKTYIKVYMYNGRAYLKVDNTSANSPTKIYVQRIV